MSEVQPRLRAVTLAVLAATLGLSRTYVSDMRAGRVAGAPPPLAETRETRRRHGRRKSMKENADLDSS